MPSKIFPAAPNDNCKPQLKEIVLQKKKNESKSLAVQYSEHREYQCVRNLEILT